MNKLLKRGLMGLAALAIPAGAALALPLAASATPLSPHYSLTIPNDGQRHYLMGTTFSGNILVQGDLFVSAATINGNVTVANGGHIEFDNYGSTVNGNLTIVDPAANSQSGFWADLGGTSSLVTGNVTYTIDSNASYPQYQSPLLYLYNVHVNGNLDYSDFGPGFTGHLYNGAVVDGHVNLLGTTPIA
jgi:hypothetical protein